MTKQEKEEIKKIINLLSIDGSNTKKLAKEKLENLIK